jgi:hypothetical protein
MNLSFIMNPDTNPSNFTPIVSGRSDVVARINRAGGILNSDVVSSHFFGYRSLRHNNIHSLPVEILSEIFLYTMTYSRPWYRPKENLMLVCWHWHRIMLSTPGICFGLKIKRFTEMKDIQARIQGTSHLDVTVDMGDEKCEFDPDRFHASFMGAAQAASRWRSLILLSLPPPGEYEDLQIVQPLQRLESFKLAQPCHLGNFLLLIMTAITTTVTPLLTAMDVANPDAAFYLVQPAHFRIFSSLTSLVLICKRMKDPVDILPHLQRLELFRAHYLCLASPPPHADLPLLHTLRVLHLKVVSVQWMAGHTFRALEDCSIIFPHRDDDTIAFPSVTMPSCSIFKYDSNNLHPLRHFSLPVLGKLHMKCGQCTNWRGTLQLAVMHPMFTASAQSLTHLRLEVRCSGWVLANMLRLTPALRELRLVLTSPHALSENFFLEFVQGPNANAMTEPSSQTIAPLCRELEVLDLHYKRWLRGPEQKALIPAFGDIVASRSPVSFVLRLGFGEWEKYSGYAVHAPVKRFCDFFDDRLPDPYDEGTYIGISTPRGIVIMEGFDGTHLKTFEYMVGLDAGNTSVNTFFSCHSLRELRIPYSGLDIESGTHLPSSLPLKVLEVRYISYSLSAGQTFHNLERFKEVEGNCDLRRDEEGLLTEMPVCTKVVVKLFRLATLKLPQIRELTIKFWDKEDNYVDLDAIPDADEDEDEPNGTWEKHIMVNSNLSGLKFLHLYGHDEVSAKLDLLQILRSLPALETLLIEKQHIVISLVDFLKAFIPMDAQAVCWSGKEDQILEVLCPRLETLEINGINLDKKPDLIFVLESVVTSRAAVGSPLKSFAFRKYNKKWELIGREGSFIVENFIPAEPYLLRI